jgi:predicted alpha-1,6-mannanase (GH76 family)
VSSAVINSSGLVNDGLTSACANNGSTVWSYNQGLAIGGFTELWTTTDDSSPLTTARTLADAAISSPTLTAGGVLTESCDIGSASCDDNQKQFKGIFMRNFAGLARATGSSTYQSCVQKQADTMWAQDRSSLKALGERWAGTGPNQTDWRTQASALGALTAAG